MRNRRDHRGQPPGSDGERSPLLTPLPGQATAPQKTRRQLLAPRKGALFSGLIFLFLLGIGLGVGVLRASSVTQHWVFYTNSVLFSPAVANGHVYVASMDGKLHAVDVQSGQEKWSFPLGSVVEYASPVVANGSIYMGAGAGPGDLRRLVALDAISGHLKWVWSYQGGMGIMSTPAVAHGIAYVGAGNGKLYALDAQSGQEKWSFPGGNFNSAPAIANGVVYTSAYGGQIYALDALSGQKKWSFSTRSPDYVAVTAAHGLVYANTTTGKVYALDARSGRQKWTYQANENILYATPVVVNTTVYVIPSGGKIVALDAFSGHVKWSYDVAEIQSTPAIANGIVYVGSFGGELSAIQGPS